MVLGNNKRKDKMFQEFNNNPLNDYHKRGKNKGKRKIHGDCMMRAFSLLWNCDWKEAAKRLFEESLLIGESNSSNDLVHRLTKPSGKDVKVLRNGESKRYILVKEFAKQTTGTRTGYLLSCAHHVVFVRNGKYYDAWDSGNLRVRSIRIVK